MSERKSWLEVSSESSSCNSQDIELQEWDDVQANRSSSGSATSGFSTEPAAAGDKKVGPAPRCGWLSFVCSVLRWLSLPILFVAGNWCLLLFPSRVANICPTLWTPAARAPEDYLLPIPTTRVQVFDLGEKAQYFIEHCNKRVLDAACEAVLKEAGSILGAEKPLTATQLLGERSFLSGLDGQRSVADRVLGFFSFVNIMWLIGITGILCTIGPCIGFVIGPFLKKYVLGFWVNVLQPVAIYLHIIGAWEVFAYVSAFLLTVQGSRYPHGSDAGRNLSLTGGLLFVPCWGYSTALHMSAPGGDTNKFLMLSHFLVANVLIPIAIIHQSSLIGFLAILAVYGGLGFIFLAFGFGFLIGFDSKDALTRCIIASIVLIAIFTGLRVLGLNPLWVKPFALGGQCLGNIMYFLGLLIASNGWRAGGSYLMRQLAMASSLFLALLIGCVYAIPAMTNTACTFLVLWLMEKQLEIDWGGCGIVVIFLNSVGLFVVSLWLNQHPEFIISMFSGKGLYS